MSPCGVGYWSSRRFTHFKNIWWFLFWLCRIWVINNLIRCSHLLLTLSSAVNIVIYSFKVGCHFNFYSFKVGFHFHFYSFKLGFHFHFYLFKVGFTFNFTPSKWVFTFTFTPSKWIFTFTFTSSRWVSLSLLVLQGWFSLLILQGVSHLHLPSLYQTHVFVFRTSSSEQYWDFSAPPVLKSRLWPEDKVLFRQKLLWNRFATSWRIGNLPTIISLSPLWSWSTAKDYQAF